MKNLPRFWQSFQLTASVTLLLILLQQLSSTPPSYFDQLPYPQRSFRAFITSF